MDARHNPMDGGGSPRSTLAALLLARFPNRPEARVRTGLSHIFSPFRTPPETTVQALRTFLAAAEETNTPVVIQIDTEHWWEARPDLWNWWDAAGPGYDPANRENVEWTGWSPDQAVKIAWRDWGKQVRILPPPNLASPRYLAACKAELQRLIPLVLQWHEALPDGKKSLLVGIKLGHETSIGTSAYHYEGGNDLLSRPAADDPVRPFAAGQVLSRGRAQLGYAEGELYDVPMNPHACPAWSFYRHAAVPRLDAGVQRNLARSDAPSWAACEYWLASGEAAAWRDALTRTLSDPRCRYVCVFNWETVAAFPGVAQGIRDVVDAGP